VDELYRVAGLWHDEGDWSHVWPIGFAWIWSDNERAAAVDAVFEGLELVGQVWFSAPGWPRVHPSCQH